jgi:hypothetical protein
MASEGLIASSTFSLWLNDLSAQTGNILFGGVDTDRFEGSLVTVPIQQVGNAFNQFFITLTGISIGSQNVASNIALAVLLDSGSSLTYLPNSMTQTIYSSVGATFQESSGAAFVPCSLRDQGTTLTFKFSSPASIAVPVDEMILDLNNSQGQPLTFENGVPACLFGILPAGTSASVLGDTFLRSAYVVYDTVNNEISLANTKFNVTTSNIVEISSKSTVPSATKASNPVAATSGIPGGVSGNSGKTQQQGSAASGLLPSLTMVSICLVVGFFM